jgi:Uma2 family endonuclease
MTVEDYFSMAEGPPYYQLIDGELQMSPSPNRFHQDIVVSVTAALKQHLDMAHCGRVYLAPSDVVLAEGCVLQPDIYFVSAERASILTDQGARGAPDLVIEVLSPGTN